MSAIDDLIKRIRTLKPIPAIVNQIFRKIEEPNSSLADLADIIIYDPLITANLLRLCNSAYFALPRKIDSIRDAVNILGIDQVVELVLVDAGAKNMTKSQTGYGLHEGELWRQAISSAIIAKELAEKKDVPHKQMIFTAALLKDIGKVVLDRFIKDAFDKINHLVTHEKLSFMEAEKKIIGIDHAELGAKIAKMWEFSPRMVRMIRNHHLSDPSCDFDTETSIVYVADNVCMMMGIGIGADGLAYRFKDEILKKIGITPVDLQIIIADFSETIQKVEYLIQASTA